MAVCELNPETRRIDVETTWVEREMIRQVPGAKWNSGAKHWSVPLSWGSCVALRGVFGQSLVIGDGLIEWAKQERVCRINLANALRALTELPESYSSPELEIIRSWR